MCILAAGGFSAEFYQTFKDELKSAFPNSQSTGPKGILLNIFYDTSITSHQRLTKTAQENNSYVQH